MNTPPTPPLLHSAFYKFVALDDVAAMVEHLRQITAELHGSILLASEGINGMVAGTATTLDQFESALLAIAEFSGMAFKRSACTSVPFRKMKVRQKAEIVPLGVAGVEVTAGMGIHVSPADWRELIKQEDVVVLDNRNSFEYRLGHFHQAVDPGVRNFRDFPEYVAAHLAEWQAKGQRIAMYCTGGIRCEKTSAWMQAFDLPVFQLEGGILHYFQSLPDADRDWEGECFVFDNRIALDTHLRETSTTLEDVYQGEPDGEWRLRRARQLDGNDE